MDKKFKSELKNILKNAFKDEYDDKKAESFIKNVYERFKNQYPDKDEEYIRKAVSNFIQNSLGKDKSYSRYFNMRKNMDKVELIAQRVIEKFFNIYEEKFGNPPIDKPEEFIRGVFLDADSEDMESQISSRLSSISSELNNNLNEFRKDLQTNINKNITYRDKVSTFNTMVEDKSQVIRNILYGDQ